MIVTDELTLEEHLQVPYVLVVYSVRQPGGRWVRRAEYPELEGLAVESPSAIDAIERVEAERVRLITRRLREHGVIPVPRSPLRRVP